MVKSRIPLRVLLTATLMTAAAPLIVVFACGPFFEPEVFVPDRPDNMQTYATGKLGIVQPDYWRADKIVAYRYLIGGHLSKEEQLAYAPPPTTPSSYPSWEAEQKALQEQSAPYKWTKARNEFAPQQLTTIPAPDRSVDIQHQGFVEHNDVLNCTDSAFETAIITLRSRAQTWGKQSADLKDWIAGQDLVFSNCSQAGNMPAPTPADASQLLKQDRAYQIAAAHFYATQYDEAIAGFQSIAQDKASPWSKWGEYLTARAQIRKAAFTAPTVEWGELAKFDPDLMQSAKARLIRVAQTSDPQIKHAALAELSFINVRLEPQKHINEMADALASPTPDPEFAQHLADLLFLNNHNVTGSTDLLQWMGLGGKTDALQQWNATHSLPWLISAISSVKPGDPEAQTLLAESAKLPATSPAYATANYYRAQFLLKSGEPEQARKLATTLLSTLDDKSFPGSRNAVLALRMDTAPTYKAFLEDAPRTTINSGFLSQAASNLQCVNPDPTNGCTRQIPPQQFDWDAAGALNVQVPLSLWIEAASSTSPLPPHLREAIAWAAWIRAIGLNEEAATKKLSPLLPPAVRAVASDSTGFPATLALLRNPGFKPYIEQGVQRSASFHTLEDFRDNWWCDSWGDGPSPGEYDNSSAHPPAQPHLSFLTESEHSAAKTQHEALDQLPNGVTWLGRRAIDYIKTHPGDPNAPEALHLTVRATRYGCSPRQDKQDAQKLVSKEAFQLLHKRYPKSPWTAKTPYYY